MQESKIRYRFGALSGVVEGAGPLHTVHGRFRASNMSTAAGEVPLESKVLFERSFKEAKKRDESRSR